MVGKWQGNQAPTSHRAVHRAEWQETGDLASRVCGCEWDYRISIQFSNQIQPGSTIVKDILCLFFNEGTPACFRQDCLRHRPFSSSPQVRLLYLTYCEIVLIMRI